MKTKLSVRFHLATWCVAIILTIIPFFGGMKTEQFTGTVIATLFWMAVYYLFFNYLTPSFLVQKKLTSFLSIALAAVLVLPFIGYSLLFLYRALFNGSLDHFYSGYSVSMHFSGLKALVMAGLFGSLFRMICEYHNTDQK